jgi:hypothetical protein
MAKKKQEDVKITIICWKCDRKFSVLLSILAQEQAVYLDDKDKQLDTRLIKPKTYVAPCPYCSAENEVKLP